MPSAFRLRYGAYWHLLLRFGRKVLQRHDQLPAFRAEAFEPVVTIERLGSVVLGIDHQREDGDLGAGRVDGRVCQQGAAGWRQLPWPVVLPHQGMLPGPWLSLAAVLTSIVEGCGHVGEGRGGGQR